MTRNEKRKKKVCLSLVLFQVGKFVTTVIPGIGKHNVQSVELKQAMGKLVVVGKNVMGKYTIVTFKKLFSSSVSVIRTFS